MGVKDISLDVLRSWAPPISIEATRTGGPVFGLIDIPNAMEKNGFVVGARLMRRWFDSPAKVLTGAQKKARSVDSWNDVEHDLNIVTLDWARHFDRFRIAQASLLRDLSVKNRKLALSLENTLMANSAYSNQARHFGLVSLDVRNFEKWYVSSKAVAANGSWELFDEIDDMYCALGAFNLHLCLAGQVNLRIGHHPENGLRATAEYSGFCIKDSFDFIGDQPLGFWSKNGPSKIMGYFVENASFNNWRNKHGRGGDFLVYSDVSWSHLRHSVEFDFYDAT